MRGGYKDISVLLSLTFSVIGLLLFNMLMEDNYFNALSILISVFLAVLLIALVWLLLNRWLDKLSCLEK